MTYPLKFRQKLIETRAREGLTIAAVASRFGVGVASLVRCLKEPTPKATRDKPARKIDMAALAQDVSGYPDAYHYERAARLGVSRSGICDAMKRIGITIKKTLTHPKASEAERTAFQERIAEHEAAGKPICLY